MKALNLTNRKFGKLLAKSVTWQSKKRCWVCECECGSKVVVPTFQLISGNNTSCGCGRLGVEVGDTFGLLTVKKILAYEKYGKGHRIQVSCDCACGGNKIAFSHYLTRGTTHHCGCRTKEIMSLSSRKGFGEALQNKVISSYKGNARNKGLDFSLTNDYMILLFKSNCYYCGDAPSNTLKHKKSYGTFTYNGIDRLDASKGYTMNNTVPCCQVCNYLKSNYTENEFLHIIDKIAKKHFLGIAGEPPT